jgi:hypothetical protein
MTNSPITALVIALAIGALVITPTFGIIIIISNIITINIIIINLIHYYSSLLLTPLAVIGLITANVIALMTANYIYY